jgi:hypothetical protein
LNKFNKIGYITHEVDDGFIHALLNMTGINIDPKLYDSDNIRSYVINQQLWFKNNLYKGTEAIQGNRFKIISTVIGRVKKTKK